MFFRRLRLLMTIISAAFRQHYDLRESCSHLNAFRSVVPNLGLQDDKWERKEVLLFILEDFSLIFEFFVKYFSKEMDAKSQKSLEQLL